MTSLDIHGNSHSPIEQLVESPGDQRQENAAPIATAFKAFGPITLFNYLTPISERTDWYRAIMRTFYQRSREYSYHLTAQDVLEVVRASVRQEYYLEACKNDLDRLVQWGNLTTLYDFSRVTTIADFRSPILRYQASNEALEIEAFLANHAHIGASEGGLHQSDLPRLWETLKLLDQWLRMDRSTYTPERRQEIAEQWYQAFTTWEKITHDAAQYLSSMHQSAQQAGDVNSYRTYKNIVVAYIHGFAQQLVTHSNAIRALVAGWPRADIKPRLLELVTSTTPHIQALAENVQIWHEDVRLQIEALTGWFLDENNIEIFLKAARDAIEKVVHHAHVLAFAMRPQTDYVSMLHTLASQLMEVDDLETAQLLYATAFAHTTPIHITEGFAGSPVAAESPNSRPTWGGVPTVMRTLRPINKGNSERAVEKPMRHSLETIYQLKQQHDAETVDRQQPFERLFQQELLDLGTIGGISPTERVALTEIIDGCLGNPSREHMLPDNSMVTLLNAEERRFTTLRSNDGILLLPRYQLRRRSREAQRRQLVQAGG